MFPAALPLPIQAESSCRRQRRVNTVGYVLMSRLPGVPLDTVRD